MEVGILVSYGGVIPGMEKEAIELFAETQKLYGEKLADGTFTYYEPFLFRTGDRSEHLGFFIVKGPQEKVMLYFDSKENRALRDRVGQVVNHLKIEFLYTGGEVLNEIAIFSEVAEKKVPALV
jgi:hypothetical protein